MRMVENYFGFLHLLPQFSNPEKPRRKESLRKITPETIHAKIVDV